MAGFCDFWENEILDHVLGASTYTPPGTLYVALSTTTPTDAGGNFTEPVGNNYARVAVTNNLTNWPAASGGSKSNGTAVTFNDATGSWGTVTHFGVYDQASGGNLLFWGQLTASKLVGTGDQLSFGATNLQVTLD